MPEVKFKIELLSYTDKPNLKAAMAARICYSPEHIYELADMDEEKQEKFIEKIVGMGHLSTIEHINFTFGIEGVSRALLAQITRHRIASFSVQSQRYVGQGKEEGEFNYIMPPAIAALGEEAKEEYKKQMSTIQSWYAGWIEKLGNKGEKSNEDARFVLPNACETRLIVTMNARELLHFFSLRCCNRAQWEINTIAWEMLELCAAVAPALFKTAGPACLRGRCSEGIMTCGRVAEVRQKQRRIFGK